MTNQFADSVRQELRTPDLVGPMLESITVASPRRNLEKLLDSGAERSDSFLEIPPLSYPVINEEVQPRKTCSRGAAPQATKEAGVWEWVRPSAGAITQETGSFWDS